MFGCHFHYSYCYLTGMRAADFNKIYSIFSETHTFKNLYCKISVFNVGIFIQEYHPVRKRDKYLPSVFHVLAQCSQSLSRSQIACQILKVPSSYRADAAIYVAVISFLVKTCCSIAGVSFTCQQDSAAAHPAATRWSMCLNIHLLSSQRGCGHPAAQTYKVWGVLHR